MWVPRRRSRLDVGTATTVTTTMTTAIAQLLTLEQQYSNLLLDSPAIMFKLREIAFLRAPVSQVCMLASHVYTHVYHSSWPHSRGCLPARLVCGPVSQYAPQYASVHARALASDRGGWVGG